MNKPYRILHEAKLLNPTQAKTDFNPRYLDVERLVEGFKKTASREMDYDFQPNTRNTDTVELALCPTVSDDFNRGNPETSSPGSLPYRRIDIYHDEMEIMNLSNQPIIMTTRKGDIVKLDNTPPEYISGKRCYRLDWKFDMHGRRKPNRTIRRGDIVPAIKEGIYIRTYKYVSLTGLNYKNGADDVSSFSHTGRTSLLEKNKDGSWKNVSAALLTAVYGRRKQPDFVVDGCSTRTIRYEDGMKYHPNENKLRPKLNKSNVGITETMDLILSNDREIRLGPTVFSGEYLNTDPDRRKYSTSRYVEAFRVEYFIPIEDIIGGNTDKPLLYVDDLDLAFASTATREEDIYHPFSREGKLIVEHYEQNNAIDEGATEIGGIKILNVDNANDRSGPTYYCNLGGVVVEVKPQRHSSLGSGIYFFIDGSLNSDNGRWSSNKPSYTRIDHNDAITHNNPNIPKLYYTADQARMLGDEKKKLEEEHDERKFDREMKKLSYASINEFLKWVPTIVASIITVIGIFL